VKDRFEFPQQLEGILDAGDVLEVSVDVCLQLCLDGANVGLELNEVTVKDVVHEVEKLVRLPLELRDEGFKGADDGLDVLEVVLL